MAKSTDEKNKDVKDKDKDKDKGKGGQEPPKPEEGLDSDDAFLREVDEALAEDRLVDLAKRYGGWVIAAIILGLGSFGYYLYSNDAAIKASGVQGEAFADASKLVTEGATKDAAAAIEKFDNVPQIGYAYSAKLLAAANHLIAGEADKATEIYADITQDEAAPSAFRDLARVRWTIVELDALEPQQVIDRLEPLAIPGAAWFGTAGELVAIAYLEQDKADVAGPLFARIAGDKFVPAATRGRAEQMAGFLGYAVENDEVTEHGEDGQDSQSAISTEG